jgi:type II secretory pathway pseudopilin PulG
MKTLDAPRAEGFTLVEVLVAVGLFVTIAIGVAQLSAVATRAARTAREHTTAIVLAAAKMDQLRALDWTYEPPVAGEPPVERTDVTTNVSRQDHASDGPGLSGSPGGTLSRSTPPYVDYLDSLGRWVGNDADPPPEAVFIRRWAVRPLPEDPRRTVVLHVLVTTVALDRSRTAGWQARSGVEALLVGVRTRKAQ